MNLYHLNANNLAGTFKTVAFGFGIVTITLESCNRLYDISDQFFKPFRDLSYSANDLGDLRSHLRKRKPLVSERKILPWDSLLNALDNNNISPVYLSALVNKFRGMVVYVHKGDYLIRGRYLMFTLSNNTLTIYNLDQSHYISIAPSNPIAYKAILDLKKYHAYSLKQLMLSKSIKLFESLALDFRY